MADDDATQPDDQDAGFAAAVEAEAQSAADDLPLTPAGLAHHMAEWMKENAPDKVSTAYWITLTQKHEQDKGVAIDVYRLPRNFHAKALAGGWSGGLGVFTPDFDAKQFHAMWSVGIGAAVAYDHLTKPAPIACLAVHFS